MREPIVVNSQGVTCKISMSIVGLFEARLMRLYGVDRHTACNPTFQVMKGYG